MKWEPIILIWNRLKERLGFARFSAGNLTLAETMRGQVSEGRTTAYRPDYREKQNEFSQHIGC
jgi:hypothetical protein